MTEHAELAGTLTLCADDLRALVDDVFSSLLDPAPVDTPAVALPAPAVTGWVDIAGGWEGRVSVCTTACGAVDVAAALLQLPAHRIVEADLADALGELANIVGGSVKSCLIGASTLSLPQISVSPPGALAPDALEVAALWQHHPLLVRVAPRPRPQIPSSRSRAE
jgi:CheY-specific phosphatase CheX